MIQILKLTVNTFKLIVTQIRRFVRQWGSPRIPNGPNLD